MNPSGPRGSGPTPELPTLDRPLGSLEFRPRATDPGLAPLATGRRTRVTGAGAEIAAVEIDGVPAARDLLVRGATLRHVALTPPGAERSLALGGTVVERLVASRDAPVVWLEWTGETGAAGEDAALTLELEWHVPGIGAVGAAGSVDAAEVAAAEGSGAGGLTWERVARGLVVHRPADGGSGGSTCRLCFVFSEPPDELVVERARGAPGEGLEVRARLGLTGDHGMRLAVIGVGPDDDIHRLFRVADRTRVAARARAGEADRLLSEGLTLSAAPALDDAVAWSLLRLADRPVIPPGRWTIQDVTRTAAAQLMCGQHGPVRELLDVLARLSADGRAPARGVGHRALAHSHGATRRIHALLDAYLDWSGDRGGAAGAGEALGWAGDGAERAVAGGSAPLVGLGPSEPPSPLKGHTDPETMIRWVVHELLGAEPDATRGRLVLRPRPPAGWERFEARGLLIGPAAVVVEYQRSGGRHRMTLRQTRGAAPLQVVLAPELPGEAVIATLVDGEPAELDVEPVTGRWRVPVQIVPDQPRTLEVEFDGALD